ncbi:MAG: 50S ribosomal protein L24 [Christensenellaceae bacterium]|jgi:large subunit ribosomal protein L24|nr:50S ribosomal protein L24 [Christensenellaceae bacterium]
MENKDIKKFVHVNVRVGDEVVVLAGKDKGKKGKVVAVYTEKNRCTVEDVNKVIKHKKARSQTQKSERKTIDGTIDISNVQILCPKCGKATRVAHKEASRTCKKCGESIDRKYMKAKLKEEKKEGPADKDTKTEKTPLKRREVKHAVDSKIVKKQVSKSTVGHRKLGGGE